MIGRFINKYTRAIYTNVNKKIYIIALIFFGGLLILTIINRLFGINTEIDEEENTNKTSYRPAETVISGEDITVSEYEEDETLINTFVEYCNNGNVDEAYDMLSSDCKEILFNNKEDFIQNYYNEIFETQRECNLQSWISEDNYNIYRVRLIDDIMSTGDYENSSNYQDYITIIQEGENKFINVKGFIYKKNLDEIKQETDELVISVISLTTYIDYEEYTFSVQNKTDKTILMDTLEKTSDTMYLELTNDKKRTCDPSGLSQISLMIDEYVTKDITIRYNKSAGTSTDEDDKIYFLNIIKDFDDYINDRENYEDILKITINL